MTLRLIASQDNDSAETIHLNLLPAAKIAEMVAADLRAAEIRLATSLSAARRSAATSDRISLPPRLSFLDGSLRS